jgi:hypothetical protein
MATKAVVKGAPKKMGRPRKHSDNEVATLLKAFERYIDETPIPILVEFAYMHKIPRETLYDYSDFSTLKKRCIDKKEAALERMALNGEIDRTMAIFSLKQLGWSDRNDISMSVKDYRVVPADERLIDADD